MSVTAVLQYSKASPTTYVPLLAPLPLHSLQELQMLQDAVGSVGRGLSQEAISALPCLQLADVKAQLPAAADSDM